MAGQGGHTRGLYGPKQARSWRSTRSAPTGHADWGPRRTLDVSLERTLSSCYPQPVIVSGRPRSGRGLPVGSLSAPAGGPSDTATAIYRSAPRTITPQRCDLSLVLTHPVPIEVRGNRTISQSPVGVLLPYPSPVQPIKRARASVSHYSRQRTSLTEEQWHTNSG